MIERAVVIARSEVVTIDDLPPRLRENNERKSSVPPVEGGLKEQMRAYEVQVIVDALKKYNGNQTEVARALQMPVRTLAHKMQTYGIKKKYET